MSDLPATGPEETSDLAAAPAKAQKTLTNRTIAICATVVVLFAASACWLLLSLYGRGSDADKARLDSIRTVGTIVLGAGGAIALLLAARRQQTAEEDLATKQRDLALRERANDDVRHDAAERRITELYLKAVEQLGSDKAPVRLAGLYALDRLAQDSPRQRQTIVSVISAYLRMPYELPDDSSSPTPDQGLDEKHRDQVQEREVRITAQRILTSHLEPDDRDTSRRWEDMRIDLTGALLINFTLHDCQIEDVRFVDANFTGDTHFLAVRFTGDTRFDGATFQKDVWWTGTTFSGGTRFDRVRFQREARFDDVTFIGTAVFREANFLQDARFDWVTFRGTALFAGANFTRNANFGNATFFEEAWLPEVNFGQSARFDSAVFRGDAWFHQVRFSSYTNFDDASFTGDIRFSGATLDGMPYKPRQLQSDNLDFDSGTF